MELSLLLFYSFLLIVVIQIIFYAFVFGKLAFFQSPELSPKSLAVSVIICAKDEEENLKKFLPLILKQDYPNFEVVLINDSSYDNSLEVMEEFQSAYPNVKIVNVQPNERFYGNKKYALTLGIRAASNDFLLLTDADCKPNSALWISNMTKNFSRENSIVLGYGAYRKIKNSFLNKLIRFETLLAASQYFSFALLKSPYMGVGRNLAYRKGLFISNKGFDQQIKIKSGDDDLLIGKIANSRNTTIAINKESFTVSEPKSTFKEWILQKRRHITTSKFYSTKHKVLLGAFYVSQFLFLILGISLISLQLHLVFVFSLVALRYSFQFFMMNRISRKLDEQDLVPFMPFLEISVIAFQMYIFIYNLISRPKHWN
ncbi:Glycosyltransferase, catalytic subunit of cellulose synthase and poly-beta-1,6-N-acetylglucosamine synthase [Flavobacteriaceae bacterium MAR_2010_188]|nr:Glycosyltransferase, catalytic subunit of cellulose synthase and poly-beta-1,6-N-acetylglucosamine synthase [Flavobacteriaceae bacterium MAR_2010_188]